MPLRSLVGTLLYAATHTRPDVSYATGQLAKHSSDPSIAHWKAGQKILEYLGNSWALKLRYSREKHNPPNVLECYPDASWADDVATRRSTSGHVIIMNESPVAWTSHTQTTVAKSTMEAEYVELANAAGQAMSIKQFLEEITKETWRINVHCDNAAVIAVANKPAYNRQRTKHIDIKHHYVRELIERKEIYLSWVSTDQQLADIFTKPLGRSAYEKNRGALLHHTC